MCMKSTPEGCELRDELIQTKAAVAGLDSRLTKVEADVGKMRSETQDAFRELNASLSNLAHDFGQRFSNVETVAVKEKTEWGKTLREILRWTARVVLTGCAVAMGITAWRSLMGGAA